MDFNFFDQPALVETKKKYANFTITPIGGPEEIKKWREMQAAKESAYRMRLGKRDERITQFEKEQGIKLDASQVRGRDWKEKSRFAELERHRLSQAQLDVVVNPPWEFTNPPPKTVFTRFKDFCAGIWKAAGF